MDNRFFALARTQHCAGEGELYGCLTRHKPMVAEWKGVSTG